MFEENPLALSPVNFFQLQLDCKRLDKELSTKNAAKYRLPVFTHLCGEYQFADVSMGWAPDRIELLVEVNQPFQNASYPVIQRGDSVELCFDTRDVKTSGFCTRFCHHFYFLPEPFEGNSAGEITRFRTEDTHELADSTSLHCSMTSKRDSYSLHIIILQQALYGFDPEQFDRLGFTYRINRIGGGPQHFSVSTDDYQIEQQPSLWSSVKLV